MCSYISSAHCNFSGLRLDALDTKVDAISNDLTSNLTEINTSLELLASQTNVSVSSDVTQLEQKVDSLESEQLPALKKDRIEMKFIFWELKNTVRSLIR